MRQHLRFALVLAVALAACGDDSAPPGGSGGSGGSSGSGGSGGTGGSGGSSVDAGPCPSVFGRYSMLMTTGAGCGDLNTSAPQCIAGTNQACFAHFMSVVSGGGAGAVNGGAMLQMDGSFNNANLIFGSVQRSGCIGSWNETTQTMTANCGGTGSSQSCTVTMV